MVKIKKCYIALLLFSTMFLGSFVYSSGDASAVSNLSVSLDRNNNFSGSNVPIFSSCSDSSCLSQYQYFHVHCDNCPYTFSNFPINFRGVSDFRIYPNTFYDLMGSTSLAFSSSVYISSSTVWTFELLTDLPSNCPSSPSGTLSITSNGTFNVSSYEYAEVDVPAPPVVTPYDGKLDALIQAVYTVGAVMLVIYFFFALYRLYIGGKT